MASISIRTDPYGSIKEGKEKSTGKIDGAPAASMASERAIRRGSDTGAGVYDERGLLFIWGTKKPRFLHRGF